MPGPPLPQETPVESNSGLNGQMEKAPTSRATLKKTAYGTTGDSYNGNNSSSSQTPSGKNSDTTKEELIARLVLSDEIIQTMRKDLENTNRRVSFLNEENVKLTKELSDSRQQTDAERTRANDVYEKYLKTTLVNKVGEESTTQKFFKEKHYEESIQKIKTEIDKKVQERQEHRSIVRTFSTALGMFVELDGADEKLGLLGESVTQTYKDAMKDNTNEPKELDVAKKIAKVDDEEVNEGGE